VRAAIEARIGAPVTGWTSHDGGYSPGLASTLRTAQGPVFVKAVDGAHEVAARLYRMEAARHAVLPEGVPAPRLHSSLEVPDGGWVALGFDAVAGSPPRTPWDDGELDAVVGLARRIGSLEAPSGVVPEAGDQVPWGFWARLADERPAGLASYDPWVVAHLETLASLEGSLPEAAAGPWLQHGDLRADNVLLRADGTAVAVDWPYAFRGAAFCDVVGMLPSVRVEGGPEPEDVLARHPLPGDTDGDAVTCYLAALTGYFVHGSLQPPPPGIPHVRAFQRAQAEVCIPWLRHRLRA
jgi:aminoglycoside phosphotransferase (APT) family kinase protein